MILILIAKIIFYFSIAGILALYLKKIFTQKEKRDKIIFITKIIFSKINIFFKQAGLWFKKMFFFIAPKFKKTVIFSVNKITQFFLIIKNAFLSRIANFKKELKPVYFSKEKKEFLKNLWEKVNKTKEGRLSVKVERTDDFQNKKIPPSIFKPIFEEKKEVSPLKEQMFYLRTDDSKTDNEELKQQVVDDPIKRDILLKQEQSLLKLITLRPKDFNIYKKLGIIYKELGNFEDARNCFEYALKLGSKDRDLQKEIEMLR